MGKIKPKTICYDSSGKEFLRLYSTDDLQKICEQTTNKGKKELKKILKHFNEKR